MVYTIYLDIEDEDSDTYVKCFPYTVREELQDVIEYLFEKKYNIEYRPTVWYLEPGAQEFVKDIEDKWWHNTFDAFELYTRDYDFKDFLKEKYYYDALKEAIKHYDHIDSYKYDYDHPKGQLSIFDFIKED